MYGITDCSIHKADDVIKSMTLVDMGGPKGNIKLLILSRCPRYHGPHNAHKFQTCPSR